MAAARKRQNDPRSKETTSIDRRHQQWEYVDLGRKETYFYFIFMAVMFILQYYWIYEASNKYFKFNPRLYGNEAEINKIPLVGYRRKDTSDWEWWHYLNWAWSFWPWVIGSSILLACLDFIDSWMHMERLSHVIMTAYGVGACLWVFTPMITILSILQGYGMYLVTRYTKSKSAIWIYALPNVYIMLHKSEDLFPYVDIFGTMTLTSYKMLSFISYCMATLDGKNKYKNDSVMENLFQMTRFAFYLPYLCSIIILYPDFEQQIDNRKNRNRNDWKWTVFFALRMIFWYNFVQIMLHFFYHVAISYNPRVLNQLGIKHIISIGGGIGQFFHLKYVVIWGLPILFARIDKMKPYKPPICVNRVALYSKIWRNFDRGLYLWFKEYIFLPICRPDFSLHKKLLGLSMAYGFVLVWHGLNHANIIWIIMNLIELLVESVAKSVYAIPSVIAWRKANISDRNFRRLMCWSFDFNYAIALYSNFYFLAGSNSGWVFVRRIFWENTYPYPSFSVAMLFLTGYCYGQCCVEAEKYVNRKEAQELAQNEKAKNE